jgi:ribonucleoside-diphosphate reductase alpha chain
MRDHFEMQRVCQKHVDNAISKTINLRPGVSEEELSDLYMEYLPELKGVTVYPEGSRENQPLTPLSLDEAMLHYGNSLVGSAGVDSCKSGVCDI